MSGNKIQNRVRMIDGSIMTERNKTRNPTVMEKIALAIIERRDSLLVDVRSSMVDRNIDKPRHTTVVK